MILATIVGVLVPLLFVAGASVLYPNSDLSLAGFVRTLGSAPSLSLLALFLLIIVPVLVPILMVAFSS